MKKRNKNQKGEQDFINACVKAVLENDITKEHYLIDYYGYMRYESFVVDTKNPIVELTYENSERAKVVCVFSKEIIEDFHKKAGDDELSKPWAKRAVKHVIAYSKNIARIVYKNN